MRRLFFHFFISELRSRRRLCKGFFIPCNFQRSIEAVSDPQSSGVDRGSIYSSLCVCFLRTDKQQHVQSPGLLETRQLFNWWTPGPGSVSVLRELRSTRLFWRVLQNPQIVILNSHAVEEQAINYRLNERDGREGRAEQSMTYLSGNNQLREIFPSCSHGVTDGAFFPWSWEERSTFLATGRRLCIHSEEACNKVFIFLPEIIKQRRI